MHKMRLSLCLYVQCNRTKDPFACDICIYWTCCCALWIASETCVLKRASPNDIKIEKEHSEGKHKRGKVAIEKGIREREQNVIRLKSGTNTFLRSVNLRVNHWLGHNKMGQNFHVPQEIRFIFPFFNHPPPPPPTVSRIKSFNTKRRVEIMPLAYWH